MNKYYSNNMTTRNEASHNNQILLPFPVNVCPYSPVAPVEIKIPCIRIDTGMRKSVPKTIGLS